MTHLDIILLIILGGFTLFGLWFGFIHAFGSLVGTMAGAFLASRFYSPVADWVLQMTGGNENLVKFVVFLLVFIIANRLVGFGFWMVEKIFDIIKIIPFLSSINSLLGGVLGLLEGALVIGLSLFFISKFPFNNWIMTNMVSSEVSASLIKVSSILWPLLPAALKQVQSFL